MLFLVTPSSIRKAWMLLYQSLGTPLCLLYKPKIIAAAAVLLGAKLSSSDRLSENWFEKLNDIDVGQVYGKLKYEIVG